jgi:hypothetical protein
MSRPRSALRTAVAALAAVAALEAGAWVGVPGVSAYIAPAEAVIGRPLTPVSVAGVGRRTVRRCAGGVYDC